MNDKLKIAILGAGGNWSQNVIRNLLKIDDIELACCVDVDNNKLEKVRKIVPSSTQLYTDFHLPLNNPDIDAVIIVTPISTHPQLIQESLIKNKHVLCQKPAFRTMEEFNKIAPLLKTEEGKKLTFMACHTFCYHPAIENIKQSLSSLGIIKYYKSTRINLGLFNRDNNVIDDLAIHDSSILTYLFPDEKIERITGDGVCSIKKGIFDTVNISIKYKSGLFANIDLSWISAVKNRQILIVGSDKTVVYDDVKTENKVCYYDAGIDYDENFLFSYKKGDMYSPQISNAEAIENELRHFFDCVRTKKEPKTDINQIAKVTKMLEAANQSVLKNGEPIYNVLG